MICIVLAAGYATRMYPLTENFPKPLLEVQGKPILNWLLEDIARIPAIEEIRVVSNHRFIDRFSEWAGQQRFEKPLRLFDDGSETNETRAGAVRDILIGLGGRECAADVSDALIIAGDNVVEFSFSGFTDYFQRVQRSCIMCHPEPDLAKRRRTGIIEIDAAGRVVSFEEKPKEPKSDLAVPPFYCYRVEDLLRIPEAMQGGCATDAPGSLAAWLAAHSEVYAWRMPGKRHDIGSLDGYNAVQAEFRPTRA